MYADRADEGTRRSIKERLNGNIADDYRRRRQISGKRQREDDDKWVHDLYEPDDLQGSIGTKDLRLKLRRKSSIHQAAQIIKGCLSEGTRDLREKLSGSVYSQTLGPKTKLKPIPEVSESSRRSSDVITEAPVLETKKVASSSVSRKKSRKKARVEPVEGFLRSLGLEKYALTCKAEEVDMAALVHMTDEDLKAMGIPMGPRKKILLALESKV